MTDTKQLHTAVETYIGLGSNLEPRAKYIERALNEMNAHPRMCVQATSAVYETDPVGGPSDQMQFLNAVAKVSTDLEPIELLDAIQQIEHELGRKRDVLWGPRTIDLDILIYGSEIISTDRLMVPHPLMHERRFVMQPLAEVAPHVVHPILEMSAETILESMGDVG